MYRATADIGLKIKRVVLLVSAAALTLIASQALASSSPDWTYQRVNTSLGLDGGDFASVSADGNRVAFLDTTTKQAYVHNRSVGTNTLASTPNGTTPGNNDSAFPEISGDGEHVAFWSRATNLTGDDNSQGGVFVRDLAAGKTIRLSNNLCPTWAQAKGFSACATNPNDSTGAPVAPVIADTFGFGNPTAADPSISADGTRVVFSAHDSHAGGGWRGIFLATIDPATHAVAQSLVYGATQNETYGGFGGFNPPPAISADGSTVAFIGQSPTDPTKQALQEYDVASRTSQVLVTESSTLTFTADRLSLSEDGRYVAFGADSIHVKIVDAATGQVVNGPSFNFIGEGFFHLFSLSADGRHLVYIAYQGGVFTWDRLTGASLAVVPSADIAGGATAEVEVDFTGDVVAFTSSNTIVDPNDSGTGVNAGIRSTTGDTVAPDWADGSTLTAGNVGMTDLTLSWTPATDDRGVDHYRLTVNGNTLANVPGYEMSYHVTGLTSGMHYTFGIEAFDQAGNAATGPSTSVTTGHTNLASLTVVTHVGGLAQLSWPAASISGLTGYRIMRGLHGGVLAQVADVSSGTTSFTDSGLAASTAYDWQVLALTGSSSQPYTDVQTGTTPALKLSSVSYSVPQVSLTVAILGSNLTISSTAEPNRIATAAVQYTNGSGDQTAHLNLSPTPDGLGYGGTFHLAEGISQVSGIDVTLSDGAGHSVTKSASGVPLAVSGALRISYSAPAGALQSPRLSAWSAATGDGNSIDAPTPDTYTMPVPAAQDYHVELRESSGRLAASEDGVGAAAGNTTALTLHPTYLGRVSAKVVDDKGSPVSGARVRASVGGNDVGSGITGSDGTTGLLANVVGGSQVTLRALPASDTDQVATATTQLTVGPGDNQPTITLKRLPHGTVHGVVTNKGGAALPNATVLVSETVDGRQWSFNGQTDTDGRYSIDALAGDATVVASWDSATSNSASVAIPASGSVEGDLSIPVEDRYHLHFLLYTHFAGQKVQGPLPLNVVTAAHLSLHWSAEHSWNLAAASDVWLNDKPGGVVSFCGDPFALGLPQSCAAATLGTSPDVTLSLTLTAGFGIKGQLIGTNGNAYTGLWHACVESAGHALSCTGERQGDRLALEVPDPGDYTLSVYAGSGLARQSFTIKTGQAGYLELGQIVLDDRCLIADPGNSISATRPSTSLGGVVELRMTYSVHSCTGTPFNQLNSSAKLAVPPGTTLVSGSVTRDGKPVSPAIGNGYAEVPLLQPIGVITYQLRVNTFPTSRASRPRHRTGTQGPNSSGDLAVGASVSGGGDEENMSPANVTVKGVTLEAPTNTNTLQVPLYGAAPAGDTVSIYDGGSLIGTATASSSGNWDANVTMVDRGPEQVHILQATTGAGANALHSYQVFVRYDTTYPILDRVTVTHNGGMNTADPRDGVAHFPVVWNPHVPLVVGAHFTNASRVSNVDITIGYTTLPATPDGSGTFTATFPAGHAPTGAVYVDYNTTHLQVTSVPDYTQQQWDASRSPEDDGAAPEKSPPPAPTDDNGKPADIGPDGSPGGPTNLPPYKITTPGENPGSDQVVSGRIEPAPNYKPTAQDLKFQQESGVPVYDLQMHEDSGGQSENVTITGYMREAWTSTPANILKFGLSIACENCGAAVDIGDTLTNEAHEKWMRINQLHALTYYCPDSATANHYNNLLYYGPQIGVAVAGIIPSAISLTADLLAPETEGASQLLHGVAYLVGKVSEYVVDKSIDLIAEHMNEDCKPPPGTGHQPPIQGGSYCQQNCGGNPGSNPALSPLWIYDPSGYAYEAVPSNRVGGATASLEQGGANTGPWALWNAKPFGQTNPQTTTGDGKYGWDVPGGWWKVVFTKPGYQPAESKALKVLPPHTDVNVPVVSLKAPTVSSINAYSSPGKGSVVVAFDKYMLTSTVDTNRIAVKDSAGNLVAGTVAPVFAQQDTNGHQVAEIFRFTPANAFVQGRKVSVALDTAAQSYAGVLMAGSVGQTVTVGGKESISPPPTPSTGFTPNPKQLLPFQTTADRIPPSVSTVNDITATGKPSHAKVSYTKPLAIDIQDGPVPVTCAPASGSHFQVGLTTVTCTAKDKAGNTGQSQFLVTVKPPRPVVRSHPPKRAVASVARFRFKDADRAAKFECALDRGGYIPCASTKKYRKLARGRHRLSVEATAGSATSGPTTFRWKIARWCVVPNVRGKTMRAARKALAKAHCSLGKVTLVRSHVARGRVVSQKPKPGKRLKRGSRVSLAISKGR